MKLFFLILFNALGLLVASWAVPGFTLSLPSNYQEPAFWMILLSASIILLVVNKVIRPILKIILFPIILLTFGLMSFIINIGLLWIYTLYIPQISVENFWALIWTSLILSIINTTFRT